MSQIKNKFLTAAMVLAIFIAITAAVLIPFSAVESRVIYPAVSWVNFANKYFSTYLGFQAGIQNIGMYNNFVGYRAGYSNSTGTDNTFIGTNAGYSNTNGYENIGLGTSALYSNINGFENIAIGPYTLYTNTEGYYNTGIGIRALYSNINGHRNTGVGRWSLYSNTSGYNNAAVGTSALYSNIDGIQNTANGFASLYSNTSGYYNTANGMGALWGNTTGWMNTAVGMNAGRYISGGATDNTTSTESLYLGYNTRALTATGNNEIVIGTGATGAGSNSATLGNTSITKTIFRGSVGIGTSTPDRIVHIVGTNPVILIEHPNAARYGVGVNFINNNGEFGIHDYLGGATRLIILSNGNVGIGTSTPAYLLDVYGTLRAQNFYSADGTIGWTGTCAAASSTTFKNGIMVSCQ